MSKKYTQNKIVESRKTLPAVFAYGVGMWLLAGLIQNGWWLQFGSFLATVYAMIVINKSNLLIRIYSRSVSAAFILLSCSAVWLFPSVDGAITQLASALILLMLFSCYQDKATMGKTFYIFLLISAVSLLEPYFILFVPVFWLLMGITVYSLSFRTFMASIIGLITPYWLYMGWLLYQNPMQPTEALQALSHFTDLQWQVDYQVLNASQIALFAIVFVLFLFGAIHFWYTSYMDKIRVRQIYTSLILLAFYTILLLAFLPHEYNMLIYMLLIAVSPITAHFFSLTHSRITNILFFVILAVILTLTGVNLWISLSVS